MAVSGAAGPIGNIAVGSTLYQLIYVTGQQAPYQVISGSGASFEEALNTAIDNGAIFMGPLLGGGGTTLNQMFYVTIPPGGRAKSKRKKTKT